jgi:hypothetical protein
MVNRFRAVVLRIHSPAIHRYGKCSMIVNPEFQLEIHLREMHDLIVAIASLVLRAILCTHAGKGLQVQSMNAQGDEP